MLKLIPNKPWATIEATVSPNIKEALKSHSDETLAGRADVADDQYILGGAILFDVFKTALAGGKTDVLEGVLGGMEYAARLDGWTDESIMTMKSVMWRSAHAFLVANTEGIDRGKEINDLAKALKI